METTQYFINEATLTLPGAVVQDSTVNIIRLAKPEAALIISRGAMNEGDEVGPLIDQQLEKLSSQVKELHYTGRQSIRLGPDDDIEGFEVKNQFIRGNERVHQYQAAFVLPGTRIMMALTYAKSTPFTEDDKAQWVFIKKQLVLRQDIDSIFA